MQAGAGGAGARRNRHGADGEDCVVEVPPGTQVMGPDGSRLCDLTADGQEFVVARGGQGGRGNTNFVSATRQAPSFAEVGLPGEELEVELRLKLLADVALVGAPNAGKSSLLRRVSNARPRVGAYPFTTLVPVLGTVDRPDGSQFTVVDVPGLLDGASEGHGLGHDFLPHLERVTVIAQLVPLDQDPAAAAQDVETISRELWAYDPGIARRDRLVVLSKRDLVDDAQVEAVRAAVSDALAGMEGQLGTIVGMVAVSSATGKGLPDLLGLLYRLSLGEQPDAPFPHGRGSDVRLPAEPSLAELEDFRVYRPQPTRRRWSILRDRDGLRVVGEPRLHELAERAASGDDDAIVELNEWLDSHGVTAALRAAGMSGGQPVTVAGHVFEP